MGIEELKGIQSEKNIACDETWKNTPINPTSTFYFPDDYRHEKIVHDIERIVKDYLSDKKEKGFNISAEPIKRYNYDYREPLDLFKELEPSSIFVDNKVGFKIKLGFGLVFDGDIYAYVESLTVDFALFDQRMKELYEVLEVTLSKSLSRYKTR